MQILFIFLPAFLIVSTVKCEDNFPWRKWAEYEIVHNAWNLGVLVGVKRSINDDIGTGTINAVLVHNFSKPWVLDVAGCSSPDAHRINPIKALEIRRFFLIDNTLDTLASPYFCGEFESKQQCNTRQLLEFRSPSIVQTTVGEFKKELAKFLQTGVQYEQDLIAPAPWLVEAIVYVMGPTTRDLRQLRFNTTKCETTAGRIRIEGYFMRDPSLILTTTVAPTTKSLEELFKKGTTKQSTSTHLPNSIRSAASHKPALFPRHKI